MINKYNIGVFDSGVGGTTVLKEILELLPNENILYYGDSGNSPYGEKTTEEIQQLCKKIVQFFIDHNCKTVVIACNTATAAALQYLQHQFDIPIIGVITAGAKTAIKITKNNSINILSTSFTALSKAYAKEIAKFAPDAKVFQEGCPEFCPMIEKGWETYSNRQKILKEHMQNLPSSSDTLILGCTHYPIIKNDIEKFFKGNIVDPAKETAIQLNDLLISKNIKNSSSDTGNIIFFVSGDLNKFKTIAEKFLNFPIHSIHQVNK